VGSSPTGTTNLSGETYDILRIWHRVAVVNDYQNTYAFLNFFKSGEHTDFVACEVSGDKPDRQEKDDVIGIHVNYKPVAKVKSRAEAIKVLDALMSECPKECRKEFEQYKEILYRSLK
jgi:hypothetical protein